MKHKSLPILSAVFIVITSLACSQFTRFTHVEATPTFNYIFTPSTVLLKVEPKSLPNAHTGVEYEVDIHVSDNVTPVNNISISSGMLPAGLELIFIDGVDGAKISGTPKETGTFTFTVVVGCFSTMVIGQTLEKDYQIIVKE